jgi:hypothetical protein
MRPGGRLWSSETRSRGKGPLGAAHGSSFRLSIIYLDITLAPAAPVSVTTDNHTQMKARRKRQGIVRLKLIPAFMN